MQPAINIRLNARTALRLLASETVTSSKNPGNRIMEGDDIIKIVFALPLLYDMDP